jgi:hypothetical protein
VAESLLYVCFLMFVEGKGVYVWVRMGVFEYVCVEQGCFYLCFEMRMRRYISTGTYVITSIHIYTHASIDSCKQTQKKGEKRGRRKYTIHTYIHTNKLYIRTYIRTYIHTDAAHIHYIHTYIPECIYTHTEEEEEEHEEEEVYTIVQDKVHTIHTYMHACIHTYLNAYTHRRRGGP